MSRFTRSMMIFCCLPFMVAACAMDVGDESHSGESELSGDEEARVGSESSELEATLICQDIVHERMGTQPCGDGWVQCTQICVTDRYLTFDPSIEGGWVCNIGEQECSPWECQPCAVP